MANTGIKIVLTLKEVNEDTLVPTGNTKPNNSDDPDYIPPSTDLTSCPISYTFDCPSSLAVTGISGNSITYEFNLSNPVVNNPSIGKVRVNLFEDSTLIQSDVFVLPIATINYFSGDFAGLLSGTYTMTLDYLDSSDNVLESCTSLATISI